MVRYLSQYPPPGPAELWRLGRDLSVGLGRACPPRVPPQSPRQFSPAHPALSTVRAQHLPARALGEESGAGEPCCPGRRQDCPAQPGKPRVGSGCSSSVERSEPRVGGRPRYPRRRAPPTPPRPIPPGTHRAKDAGGGGVPGPRTRLQAPCPLRAAAARCPGPTRPGSRRGASPAAAAAAASAAASAPRRGRRASLPQAVAGGGTGCISPGYIAGPESRRGGVGNAEPAELPAPHVRGGTERKRRRGRGGGGVDRALHTH